MVSKVAIEPLWNLVELTRFFTDLEGLEGGEEMARQYAIDNLMKARKWRPDAANRPEGQPQPERPSGKSVGCSDTMGRQPGRRSGGATSSRPIDVANSSRRASEAAYSSEPGQQQATSSKAKPLEAPAWRGVLPPPSSSSSLRGWRRRAVIEQQTCHTYAGLRG